MYIYKRGGKESIALGEHCLIMMTGSLCTQVELYEVKKNGRNIEIRRVYTHEENKSSSLDLHRLQDALMFMYKFYSNNQ